MKSFKVVDCKVDILGKSLHAHRSVLACVVHFFKVRYTAKKFDIWEEKIDQNRERDSFMAGDWIGYDGVLYYGHPLGIFFKSAQNSWWLNAR